MVAIRIITEFFGGKVDWKDNKLPINCEIWPG